MAVVSDCTRSQVENDARPARRKQYTHTGIAYAHLTATHSREYMGYVRHVGEAASSKKHVITWARICQVLTPREVE